MALAVKYLTVDGEVLSETRGGTRRDYVPNPLGSTIALLNSSQTKTDTMSYWPYGEEIKGTSTATPLRFGGTLGYYTDSSSRVYVRARVLEPQYGRWLTVDPLWPAFLPYAYCGSFPTNCVDPSGKEYDPTGLTPCIWHQLKNVFRPSRGERMKACVTCCQLGFVLGGAGVGSLFPGLGTIIGGVIGGIVGEEGCDNVCDCLLFNKDCPKIPCNGSIYSGMPEVPPGWDCPPGYKTRKGCNNYNAG